jgi:hypothetical protein
MTALSAKIGVIGSIIVILVLTVLEFPPPIGFETRPQGDVSMLWLIFFLIILVTEIATIPFIFIKPALGQWFGIVAAILNILQVIADQLHLIQPEVAPFGYSLLEYTVALASIALVYFSLKAHQHVIPLTLG